MDLASHRACAHCRSQKVRCISDEENPDVCQRCARSGRACVFTPLQKRKQRKRTDTRVAELEREMRTMRALLKHRQESAQGTGNSSGASTSVENADAAGVIAKKPQRAPEGVWFSDPEGKNNSGSNSVGFWVQNEHRAVEPDKTKFNSILAFPSGEASRATALTIPDKPSEPIADVIDRGVLSMSTARTLFEVYKRELFPHYPTVLVPETMTADEMRNTKPVLFLAVIAAAAMKAQPPLSTILDQEVLQMYARKSLMGSEKSVEIVQALLVSAVWYHPPNKFGQLKYYQYIHWAASMAMDVHIGERANLSRLPGSGVTAYRGRTVIHFAEDVSNPSLSLSQIPSISEPDTNNLESRRTFLACFSICAGVSLSLRRPSMLRVNSYVRECIEYMQTSPNVAPSDRRFVAWCRLMVISEEISHGMGYEDPGGLAQIEDLRCQLMLRDYERKLTEWEKSIPEADFNDSLRIMYYNIRIYLNEVALHIDHNPEDFKAPYQMGPLSPRPPPNDDEFPTQPLVNAISDIITSAHRLLDTFLRIDPEHARGVPVFTYVRVSYATFALAKLCLSAAHPEGRIYKVLDRSALKVESYMDRAILHVKNIVGPQGCRVPAIFLALLFKLRSWSLRPELIDRYGDDPTASLSEHDKAIAGTALKVAGGYVHDMIDSPTPRLTERVRHLDDNTSHTGDSNGRFVSESPSVAATNASPTNSSSSVGEVEQGTDGTPSGNNEATTTGHSREPARSAIPPATSEPLESAATPEAYIQQPALGGMPPSFNSPGNLQFWLSNSSTSPQDAMDLDSTNNFIDLFSGPVDLDNFMGPGLTGLEDWPNYGFPQGAMDPNRNLPQDPTGAVGGLSNQPPFFQNHRPGARDT